MILPFPRGVKTGPYYNLGVVVLWPGMMLLTRRDWRGQENLGKPGQGIVVAANHMSWFDPIVMLHFMNDSGRPGRFLVKDALFEVPALGRIATGAGQIPVHRESSDASKAVSSAVEAVNDGEAVIVYVEGTLTRDPDLWPMSGKTGAARIALLSGCPIVPVAHWGAQEVMRPYQKELRLFPPKTIHVAAGSPVDLDDLRELPLTTAVLEEATTRVMDDITALQADFRGEDPPEERWSKKAEQRLPVIRGLAANEEKLAAREQELAAREQEFAAEEHKTEENK